MMSKKIKIAKGKKIHSLSTSSVCADLEPLVLGFVFKEVLLSKVEAVVLISV